MNYISIIGAQENNLRNIDLQIPRNKLVCFIGVSGSGKSTIAFDIIAREGQRQYFESLSSYARRYLAKGNRPDVEEIRGISSTLVIDQKRVRGNPRSTVGTMTEAYTYLRLLFSRVGYPIFDSSHFSFNHPQGACPVCKGLGRIIDFDPAKLIDFDKSLQEGAIIPRDFYVGGRRWSILKASGYFDMDKKIRDYTDQELERLLYGEHARLSEDISGFVQSWSFEGIITGKKRRNSKTNRSMVEKDMKYMTIHACPDCGGARLREQSLQVKIQGRDIGEVANMSLVDCLEFVSSIEHKHATVIKPRLIEQLEHLIDVGLGYLALNRASDTLSGGEAQRVKLARQLGCDLTEMIYVLDEPTAGLHAHDVEHIISSLMHLRDLGNTVITVEHDESVIRAADHIIELGEGGGKRGGKVIAQGTIDQLIHTPDSVTAPYLQNKKIFMQRKQRRTAGGYLSIADACRNNLKHVSLEVPTGQFIALTGVSGAGKSSLVEELTATYPDKVVLIDQKSIGTSRRGCIATYAGILDHIRTCFATKNKVSSSLFSFNSKGGCSVCKGMGYLLMDMNFLGDVKLPCEQCEGRRYHSDALRYKYRGSSIAAILDMTATQIGEIFYDHPPIKKAVTMLEEVGLDYIEMGQTLDTLSGGESQRLKLASKLQQKGAFFILDEPTSGLHFRDIEKLLALLHRLVDQGNSVMVVEHTMPVVASADYIIDMGPRGGDKGGEIVAEGTPSEIAAVKHSHTGKYLKQYMSKMKG